ncbi:sulfite oxidase [Candidatus Poribacteria bacterium]|nr:sulfite oxidase [Candidatus Poribacteria bacterium]MYB63195.1 sulfite oxidase [Candidatus Poribacteria bacterium]
MDRRDFIRMSGLSLTGFLLSPWGVEAFPKRENEELIPFLDQPSEPPAKRGLLDWSTLDSFITPNDEFFNVSHYNKPVIDEDTWKLEIIGLVDNPMMLTIDDIKARPKQDVIFTLECSGNHGFPTFTGAIGNAKWAGTPLAPILKEAGIQEDGIEVIFFGHDSGVEKRRGNDMPQNFARSMSVEDALEETNILCYEMNGEPLPQPNGAPLRLIAPGWYGIACVKWLKRIEIRDTRLMNRFMGRDYVTIREEKRPDGESVWMETSVGRTKLKSLTAKVTRIGDEYRIYGAAWGAPIKKVEVRIDDAPWQEATIDPVEDDDYAWKIWHLNWDNPPKGEHTIVSRAIDTKGNIQPAGDSDYITKKRTYWESNGQVVRRIRIE